MTTGQQQLFDMSYAQMLVHLFNIGQSLCGQTHGVTDRLRQEIALITQGHAQLLLRS